MDFLSVIDVLGTLMFISLCFWWMRWHRTGKRLPEEFGHVLFAEVIQFWAGRLSLYDDFLVICEGTIPKRSLIPYTAIQRVGIGRAPLIRRAAILCIDYADDQGIARLAQFQCADGSELLPVLAERLKAAGKGNLVTWPDTHETELDGGVKAD